MNRVFKALVVDDHPLFAQATKQLLEKVDRIQVIGAVGTGKACMDFIRTNEPDIVFLDYQLPDQTGSKIAEQIKEYRPSIHVVIFTGFDIADLMNHFIELKVSGVISKESSESTIINMVHCILDDHTMVPLSLFRQMRLNSTNQTVETLLTEDEVHIMTLIVKGDTHEQVAEQIHISKRSVDNYLKKIYEKLGVGSKVQAIEKFIQSKYYTELLRGSMLETTDRN